jgi:hypothetical protein
VRQKLRQKLFLISVLFFCSAFSRPTTFDERTNCEESAGVWREFGKSCNDECEAKLDQFSICSNISTYGCECGKSRCWNGEKKTCVAINDYKKIFTARKEKEKEISEEARKKREEASEESQQNILNSMTSIDKAEEKITKEIVSPTTEQPKVQTPPQQPTQPPSPIVNTSPNIPPLFLQQEKTKQESEREKQEKTPSPPITSIPGLPVIPLPQ